jgi:alanyl-tRNA synthetase
MKTVSDIRTTFLNYFAKQGHTVVPSAPLVPQNDPTLMFTAAGMVPFKDYFTGKAVPPYLRAASSQKCVRAGGKHNDLDNVGYTERHLTFFEMLGNFSFGDYFKDDAIKFAWELVTKEFGLPKDKLTVTIYHTDDEAAAIWKKVAGLSDDKIIRIATSDNFWSAGPVGPCGPCTEIFYDHGEHVFGGPPGSKDEDGDRFMEIWNLVFMQYDQLPDGSRVDLPKPSIDTGSGLERLSGVLQGKKSIYETDLFQTIIQSICDLTSTKPEGDDRISQRIISDHLRASAFLISEGVLPSNEGRGYVLRRIMRRAMRHAHLLGAKEPLMHRLVPTLAGLMGDTYPQLLQNDALIKDTLYREENRFRETLERGLKLLDEETAKLPSGGKLAGETAFKLYDTFGFPLDLTNDVLVRKGYALDEAGFESAMQKQKEMGRQSWTGSGDKATEKIWFDIQDQVGAFEFLGYSSLKAQGVVKAIVMEGKSVTEAKAGDSVSIVLSQTPFYAESGGQIGDTGTLTGEDNFRFAVKDTQKPTGTFFVHAGMIESGSVKVGDGVEAIVDAERRAKLQAHHSAAHLLHEALKRELGDHVAQKGSLIEPTRLRLDFAQPDPITPEQMKNIVAAIEKQIAANAPVTTNVMTLDEARATGARALFGEKYGNEVRVVSMGTPEDNRVYSIELCGGTHAKTTGEIGPFRITSEGGISAGVRRVQAVVGEEVKKLKEQEASWADKLSALSKTTIIASAQEKLHMLQHLSHTLKTPVNDVVARVEKLLAEKQDLINEKKALFDKIGEKASELKETAAKDIADFIKILQADINTLSTDVGVVRKKAAMGGGDQDVEQIGAMKFLSKTFDDLPAKDLKPLADQFKKQIGSGVVVLLTKAEGRVSLVVGVTDDLLKTINAVDLVRVGAEALGGKGGGGRPDMAQAGGPDAHATSSAVNQIKSTLTKVA